MDFYSTYGYLLPGTNGPMPRRQNRHWMPYPVMDRYFGSIRPWLRNYSNYVNFRSNWQILVKSDPSFCTVSRRSRWSVKFFRPFCLSTWIHCHFRQFISVFPAKISIMITKNRNLDIPGTDLIRRPITTITSCIAVDLRGSGRRTAGNAEFAAIRGMHLRYVFEFVESWCNRFLTIHNGVKR